MQQFIEFFLNHWDLFLALIIILLLMLGGPFVSRLRGYRELSPQEAVQIMNHEDAWVLDVREDKEVAQGYIVDALHIPLGKLRERIGELDPRRDKPVVVNCRSGHRSASACSLLRKNGFESVYNLRGGIMAWQNSGLPVQKPGKKKKRK